MKNLSITFARTSALAWLLLGTQAQAQTYRRVSLLSDGTDPAPHVDSNLVNPWGIAASPDGPFWISNNGTGTAAIVLGDGSEPHPGIDIPQGGGGTPTGIVFNDASGFVVHTADRSGPSRFLFATEDGTILGWSPDVDSASAHVAVDDSALGAVYKGLALGSVSGRHFLYATDFASGRVVQFDESFARVGSFSDDGVPAGYSPFGIARVGDVLIVTFAQREEGGTDDVPGPGHGIVDVFTFDGRFLRRLVTQGLLDSPWGIVQAPAKFGKYSKALLVGNFGDGRIHAYNLETGALRGTLEDEQGEPVQIDGLWGLAVGNGHQGGDPEKLYFTAGSSHEAHGLFGAIERVH